MPDINVGVLCYKIGTFLSKINFAVRGGQRLRVGERSSGIPRPRMSAKVFPLLMYYALQCSLGFTELAGRLARLFLEETAEGLLLVESQ